jgi:hypothetical protein
MFMPMRSRIGPLTTMTGGRAPRGRHDAVRIELGRRHRFHRGDDHRQVLGLASRHDRIGGDLFDSRGTHVRRQCCDHLTRVATGSAKHAFDPLGRGRNYRQAIGEAAFEHEFERILLADFDLPRHHPVAARFRFHPLGDFGFDRLRAASGALLRIFRPIDARLREAR